MMMARESAKKKKKKTIFIASHKNRDVQKSIEVKFE